jgi:hypothetical protein
LYRYHADVKLAQAERLLAEAGKFLEDNKVIMATEGGAPPTVVIAGDFNSVPGSEVHLRMLRGITRGDSGGGGAGGREGGIVVSLYSAYASALAENRILGGSGGAAAAGAGNGGASVGSKRGREGDPMEVDRGDAGAAAAAAAAAGVDAEAAVAVGAHGEPAHTNVTPG